MAVLGIGADVTEVARIRAALERPRTGARFRARIFTSREQAYCEARGRARYQSYAARFAAKEATMKALGRALGWLEIEVVRLESGRPEVVLHGAAAAYAARHGVACLHLALTHTAEIAVAHVIAERG